MKKTGDSPEDGDMRLGRHGLKQGNASAWGKGGGFSPLQKPAGGFMVRYAESRGGGGRGLPGRGLNPPDKKEQ